MFLTMYPNPKSSRHCEAHRICVFWSLGDIGLQICVANTSSSFRFALVRQNQQGKGADMQTHAAGIYIRIPSLQVVACPQQLGESKRSAPRVLKLWMDSVRLDASLSRSKYDSCPSLLLRTWGSPSERLVLRSRTIRTCPSGIASRWPDRSTSGPNGSHRSKHSSTDIANIFYQF